eukprot:GFUD01019908.1.p1 GENE.GFUD01019908.1~~GFUD01019908.1.p1  ORF type:complete len:169 (+),score=33.27 GFUD01019908.1:85-591(+)
MSSTYDFTCLSGTTTNMCKNCTRYAREMINKRYNKVVKALSDKDGNLNISRAERFENLFLEELNKRLVNNFWRTDQKLHHHLHKRIIKEKTKPEHSKIKINLKTDLFKDRTDMKVVIEDENKKSEDDFETISTMPDNGVCRRFWNPSFYELDLESEPFIENILEDIRY